MREKRQVGCLKMRFQRVSPPCSWMASIVLRHLYNPQTVSGPVPVSVMARALFSRRRALILSPIGCTIYLEGLRW